MSKKQGDSASPADRRAKAAAARAEQEAAEKRRDRMIKVVGGLAVLVVVGAIIGGAVWQSRGSGSSDASVALPSPNPDAPLPKGVVNSGDNAFAVPFPANSASDKVPLLQIWEDFQCPSCQALEAANGQNIEQLATDGKARLYWRPTAFLDERLLPDNTKNNAPNSSHRAIAAWGCAIDAGKTREYHDLLYANQPATEGVGFTQAQLLDFGKQAGISGDAYTTFETCVKDGTYLGWAVNSLQAFNDAAVPGTPAGFINGTEVKPDVLADKAKLEAALAEAAKK